MLNGRIVILQVIGGLNVGGAESRIMDILRLLDRRHFQYDFLLNEAEGAYEEEAKSLGSRIFRTVKFSVTNKKEYLRQLREFFAAHPEIDIVQGHTTNTAALYLPLAKQCGIKCTMAHARSAGVDPGLSGLIKRYYRRGLKDKADICLACSREAARAVYGRAAAEGGRVRIIPNAIDVDSFAPTAPHFAAGRQLREKLGLTKAYVVGHVGRFHYAKNHEFLLKVFAEIKKVKSEAVLLLVGDGELKDSIEKKAQELNIRESVIFAGKHMDVAPFYQAMDVLVFPSRYEGLPGTVVEAQASGLPVLMSDRVTKDVCVTELVQTAALTDSPALWETKALMLSAAFSRKLRSGNMRYAEKLKAAGFDVKQQVRELERMYRECVDDK